MIPIKEKVSPINMPDKAAGFIADTILRLQHWFANNMKSISQQWKQQQQWIFLIGVCFLFGGLSIASIVNANNDPLTIMVPERITFPKNTFSGNDVFLITENEFQKVLEYKRNHPNLQQERSALFDSLNLIEQSYYSQKIKRP